MVTNMRVSTARGTLGRPGLTSAARLMKNWCAVAVSLTRGMGASNGRRCTAPLFASAYSTTAVAVLFLNGRFGCALL
jgi:hypothetical protein